MREDGQLQLAVQQGDATHAKGQVGQHPASNILGHHLQVRE